MKSPRSRVPIFFSMVGTLLMGLCILFNINPIDASLVSPFLRDSTWGWVIRVSLMLTCMPVWIVAVLLGEALPLDEPWRWRVACTLMLVIQAGFFYWLGRFEVRVWRRFR